MPKLYTDRDKYAEECASAVVEAFHGATRELVRQRWKESGVSWNEFVFGKSFERITRADFDEIEKQLLDAGHRFDWSAAISVKERPEAYKPAGAASEDGSESFQFQHPEAPSEPADADGRELRGVGDNVVQYPANAVGVARYVRSSARVLAWLSDGVPADTIALIDDSGGTLTAPILSQFKGVACAGGTVRSHLGILCREFGIPCLMNAKIGGIREGDRVEIESSGRTRTAADYAANREVLAKIWKLAAGGRAETAR